MSFPRGAFVALLCVLYACAVSAASQVTSITATVACAAGSSPHAALSCRLSSGHANAGGTAWGTFNDTIAQNGWSQLEVWTQRADAASLRETAASCGVDAARILAFGVGCVEGALTQARIFQMVTNAKANLFPGGVLPTVAKLYLGVQVAAVRGGVAAHYKPIEMPGGHATHARGSSSSSSSVETRYWQGMGVVMAHFDGLAAAYNATAPAGSNITDLELYAASSADDLGTLVNLATARSVADSKRILSKLVGAEVTAAHVEELSRVPLSTPSVDFLGCSAYVKVLPSSSGKTEDGAASPSMLVSHATWSNMYVVGGGSWVRAVSRVGRTLRWEMLRTYKMFHLAYAPAGTVSFSSYPGVMHMRGRLVPFGVRVVTGWWSLWCGGPGFLASGDDFYTAQDTQLAVVETTNNIYNNSLYEHLDPFAAFSWQRAIAATWFGTGPADWAALFGFQNSGTYNCNWMATRLDGTVPSPSALPVCWVVVAVAGRGCSLCGVMLCGMEWPASTDYYVELEQVPGALLCERVLAVWDKWNTASLRKRARCRPRGVQGLVRPACYGRLHCVVQHSSLRGA